MSEDNVILDKQKLESETYLNQINRGRVEFERALDALLLEGKTWQQLFELLSKNEREHHD